MGTRPKIQPSLVIIDGKEKGKVITLAAGTSVVGRSRADITISDPRISRSHVALSFDLHTGKLTYTDLKSLNGTLVNGEKVEAGELNDGDRLQLGDTTFDCQLTALAEGINAPKEAPKVHKTHSNRPEPAALIEVEEDNERTADPTQPLIPRVKRGAGGKNSLWQLYLRIPPRGRRIGLSLVAILGGLWYFTNSNSAKELAREVASIHQLEMEGKNDAAIDRAMGLTKEYPNRSEGFYSYGVLLSNKNQNNEAVEAFEKAHALPPEQPLIHVKMIRAYLKGGQSRKAITELEHLEKIFQSGKFSRELFVDAASVFLEFKELKQAPEKTLILARALQKEYAPTEAIGYKLEAQLHFQQNQVAEAIPVLEKARTLAPQDEWIMENLVFGKLEMKDFPGAEKVLDDWLTMRSSATKALLIYGYLKYNEKNYARAMPYVQKILQVAQSNPADPHYPEALNLMGQIFVQMGQTADATTFFRQSCQAGFTAACEADLLKHQEVTPPVATKKR